MGPEALAQVLRPLREMFRAADYPQLLVGLQVADDAAVYQLTEDVAAILTLDFFTPVVDDPYAYGTIAAANAMSDVYAMGGEVALALNIAAFPPKMPAAIVSEVLRGGGAKVREGGGVLAGGHTIDDEEPKYGLAVMGLVHPARILTKGGAHPGDALVLTKPLGAGIVTTAAKGDAADAADLEAAIASMARLNRVASEAAQQAGAHAMTDITGFGLLGHASEMAERSGAQLLFRAARLPFLPGARRYAEEWLFPAGTCSNERFYRGQVQFASQIPEELRQLLYTPETSGGLLIAVSPDMLPALQDAFRSAARECWIVGEVTAGSGVAVTAD